MANYIQEIDDVSSPLIIKEIIVKYEGGEEVLTDINDLTILGKIINTILLQRFLQGDKK